MGEDAPVVEQRLAAGRHEIDATLDALAYQANLKARLPEYANDLVGAIVSGALALASRAGSSAANRADVLANQTVAAVKRAPRSVLLRGIVSASAFSRRLLMRLRR